MLHSCRQAPSGLPHLPVREALILYFHGSVPVLQCPSLQNMSTKTQRMAQFLCQILHFIPRMVSHENIQLGKTFCCLGLWVCYLVKNNPLKRSKSMMLRQIASYHYYTQIYYTPSSEVLRGMPTEATFLPGQEGSLRSSGTDQEKHRITPHWKQRQWVRDTLLYTCSTFVFFPRNSFLDTAGNRILG